jgi:hypothetical protein
MIQIVWDTVRSELPVLLEGLSVTEEDLATDGDPASTQGRLLYALEESIGEIRQHIVLESAERREVASGKPRTAYPVLEAELASLDALASELRELELRRRQLIDGHSRITSDGEWGNLIDALDTMGQTCFSGHWVTIRGRIGGTKR